MDPKTDQQPEARPDWSAGTVASPRPLPPGDGLRPLSPMELEHLACRAGEPYRDPERNGTAAQILERRLRDQSLSGAEPSSHWQRRWGLARRHCRPQVGPHPQASACPQDSEAQAHANGAR